MSDILAKICDDKRVHVARCKELLPLSELRKRLPKAPAVRGFIEAIEKKHRKQEPALIAEIKRASPSKGVIRQDFFPPALARAYEMGGAACLSVLTDIPYFQGRDDYLAAARNACALPVLRKDFMLEPYQIVESRILGADAVLLILSALDDETARELESTAMALGMDVLIEVHDHHEMARALAMKSRLIGINSRNLRTMDIDLARIESMASLAGNRLLVAESGISDHADLKRLQSAGLQIFLVGSSLMAQDNVTKATRELLGKAETV